jgi:hypothetical protein
MTKPRKNAPSVSDPSFHSVAEAVVNSERSPALSFAQEIMKSDLPDRRRLHEATDRLNAVLLDTEKALAELELGVTAEVVLEEDERDWFKVMEFKKVGREFKLVITTGVAGDPDSFNSTALTSASRETRLAAVEALPKLYQKLLKAFETEVARVNNSITEVQRLADAIRAKGRE